MVEAFKSTLEEASMADVILNVCDASSVEFKEHLEVTERLLDDLGANGKPMISILNKCDLVDFSDDFSSIGKCVPISAKHGTGIDELLVALKSSSPDKEKSCVFISI